MREKSSTAALDKELILGIIKVEPLNRKGFSFQELVGRVLGNVSIDSKVYALQSVKPMLNFE